MYKKRGLSDLSWISSLWIAWIQDDWIWISLYLRISSLEKFRVQISRVMSIAKLKADTLLNIYVPFDDKVDMRLHYAKMYYFVLQHNPVWHDNVLWPNKNASNYFFNKQKAYFPVEANQRKVIWVVLPQFLFEHQKVPTGIGMICFLLGIKINHCKLARMC